MISPPDRFPMPAAAMAAALVLLAVMTALARPASGQGATSPCAAGAAVVDAAGNPGLVSDCGTLLAARDTLAGSATLNWSAGTPIAEWEGVTVEGTPLRVTVLSLSFGGLTGEMPPELGGLANLELLLLTDNQLTGEIPPELASLTNLERLYLFENQLTGSIPPELGSLTNLERLYLYSNELTGEIPSELGSLANLERLYLYDNQLTGERYRRSSPALPACKCWPSAATS